MNTSMSMKRLSTIIDTFTTNTISTSMIRERLWASPIAIHIVTKEWSTFITTFQTYIIGTPTRSGVARDDCDETMELTKSLFYFVRRVLRNRGWLFVWL